MTASRKPNRPTETGAPHRRFTSIGELADQLNVTPRSVRRWLAAGELPFFKLGRSVRIAEKDVEVFLEARRR